MNILFAGILFLSLLFITVYLLIGYYTSRSFADAVSDQCEDKGSLELSIVVAARNESRNIQNLIASLKVQEYSGDCFEAVFVDDSSTDDTRKIIEKAIACNKNFHAVSSENKTLPAKKGALSIGIRHSVNPYIVITDADCIAEKKWLKAFSDKFQSGFDFLFGLVPFYRSGTLVNSIACFENLRNSLLTVSAASFGFPYSAAARSFAFKRTAFKNVNGYDNTLDTISGDDDLLIREAVKHKLKVGVLTARNSYVYSKTPESFKEYFSQKARHVSTSHHYLPEHQFFLGSWHLMNLFFLFSPFFSVIHAYFMLPFITKLIMDIFIVKKYQQRFSYDFKVREIICLQITYEVFLIVNFANSLFRKTSWK